MTKVIPYISVREIAHLTGWTDTGLYRMIDRGVFPAPTIVDRTFKPRYTVEQAQQIVDFLGQRSPQKKRGSLEFK